MENILDNKYFIGTLTMFIFLYSATIRPNLPPYIKVLFKNSIFKTFICFLIVVRGNKDPIFALAIAIAFVTTLTLLNQQQAKEAFEGFNNEKFDNSGYSVILYTKNDYSGESASLDEGKYDTNNLGIPANSLSSLKIPVGLKVTLFDKGNFSGRKLELTSDENNLSDNIVGGSNFTNKTSSIKVEKIPVLYEENDLSGKGIPIDEGEYKPSDLNTIGMTPNRLSSVKVPIGFKVTLFDRGDFSGRKLELLANSNNLSKNIVDGSNFNNKTSSIRVERVPILYENCDYSGKSVVLDFGEHNINDLGLDNDSLSSIKIPNNINVTLYEHADFQGRKLTLNKSESCLSNRTVDGLNFDNQVSSIKIVRN